MKKLATISHISIISTMVILMVLSGTVSADASTLQISSTVTPSSIVPGNEFYIQLSMTNTGTNKIDSIKIRGLNIDSPLKAESPIYLDNLGALDYNKVLSQSMKFKVPASASSGFYRAEFSIDACDTSTCKSYTHYAVVTVQSQSGIELEITPAIFQPGKVVNVTFIIKNKAAAISNVNVQWTSNFSSPIGTSNNFFITEIGTQSTVSIPVSISTFPGTETGISTMTVTLSYNDQTGSMITTTFNIGILVKSDINLLTSSEAPDSIIPGSKGTVSIKISNAGDDIKFLVIKVSSDDLNLNPDMIYVGNLDSDDYDTEKIVISAEKSLKPGIYDITMTMSYQDVFGEEYTNTTVIPVEIFSRESVQPPNYTLTAFGLVVLVIIISFVVFRIRRKRSE
ncbi:MAG: hypothetical protein ABIA21_01955 [Candidatus Aenigmatarchaeota archaeon]